ncbi:MAG: hypothetical protein VZR95_05875 [Alphaproteobacteria bacterium]
MPREKYLIEFSRNEFFEMRQIIIQCSDIYAKKSIKAKTKEEKKYYTEKERFCNSMINTIFNKV